MKAIHTPNHELFYQPDALQTVSELGDDLTNYYDFLKMASRPDRVYIQLSDIQGLTYPILQLNEICSASISVFAASISKDEGFRCEYVIEVAHTAMVVRYNRTDGWSMNGVRFDDDDPMTYSDMIGEFARLLDTNGWPKDFLDSVDTDDTGMMSFVETVLLPQAARFRKETTYRTTDYGAVSDEASSTNIVLSVIKNGPVRDGQPIAHEDFLYMAVEASTPEGIKTSAIGKSSFGTTSTDVYTSDGYQRTELPVDPDDYVRQIEFGIGVLKAQKALDMVLDTVTV